jgi:hypothetical protein
MKEGVALGLVYAVLYLALVAMLTLDRTITQSSNVIFLLMMALIGYAVFGWPF